MTELKMPVMAVLWDLDGVIVDSGRFHWLAYREVLLPLGVNLPEEEYRARLFGRRNDDIMRAVLGNLGDERIWELARAKEEAFRRLVRGHVRALPGALELLRAVRAAARRQAIVSSTPQANIQLILESLGAVPLLNAIVGEEDVARGKPDPEGFLLAAQRLAARPEECVVVEDAPEGIAAGKAAGMRCLAVATTRAPERLRTADLVVPSLEDERVRTFLGLTGTKRRGSC